jgi:curved DNA-binding protein CbpA
VSSGPSPAEARRVLGVDPEADASTIRRAYRERAKETHPDTEDGDEAAFKRVNAAYERLSD